MSIPSLNDTISVFAPVKINLYLHIIRRREDGYHDLDSLVTFADIGDRITIHPARRFSFAVSGPGAGAFVAGDLDDGPKSTNLVVRAARALAEQTGRKPNFRIELKKNIPLGSGLGGGSADAAAVLWALINAWNLPKDAPWLAPLMAGLGADVPACFACASAVMRETGTTLSPAPAIPEMPVLLVHPKQPSDTAKVYKALSPPFIKAPALPDQFESAKDFVQFLKTTRNDLTAPAIQLTPAIDAVLDMMAKLSPAPMLSRMSGSGAACFALFERQEDAISAAEIIMRAEPKWWVRTGTINTPQRY